MKGVSFDDLRFGGFVMDGQEVVVGSAEEAAAEIGRLQEALNFERMKNQVLVEQLISLEDQIAAGDVEKFADVIPEEDKEYWAGQLVTNRESAIGALERIRNRMAQVAVPPAAEPAPAVPAAAPAAPAAAPASPPRPLHNRSAKAAVAEPGAERGGPDAARCSRIANRSRELVRSHGISFDAAWRRAEAELGE
jgi:hypothetical protein